MTDSPHIPASSNVKPFKTQKNISFFNHLSIIYYYFFNFTILYWFCHISLLLTQRIFLYVFLKSCPFWMDRYTLLYLKLITNKNLLYSTWNSAQCYVATQIGGEFGEEWIHVYVWLRPFAVHLKLSQHR